MRRDPDGPIQLVGLIYALRAVKSDGRDTTTNHNATKKYSKNRFLLSKLPVKSLIRELGARVWVIHHALEVCKAVLGRMSQRAHSRLQLIHALLASADK